MQPENFLQEVVPAMLSSHPQIPACSPPVAPVASKPCTLAGTVIWLLVVLEARACHIPQGSS